MTKLSKLLSNIAVVVIAAAITISLPSLKHDLNYLYPAVNALLLAIPIFIMALALARDSSLPDILKSDGENGKGVLSKIPFARLLIALAVYVVFETCASTLPGLLSLATTGGNITAPMLLLAAYHTVKWYAIFFILSFKAEKPIKKLGFILAFILPFIIILTEKAILLIYIHVALNNSSIQSYFDAMAGNRYSHNPFISSLLQICFTAAIPTIYIIIGALMRKKKAENICEKNSEIS
ncbi:MAG: hypothetical protein IKT78_04800 [Ruminiclostridium sp.]|nr:hypothetical protein [Ruminiclostridium sp.]